MVSHPSFQLEQIRLGSECNEKTMDNLPTHLYRWRPPLSLFAHSCPSSTRRRSAINYVLASSNGYLYQSCVY
jgi:hypothetical protein